MTEVSRRAFLRGGGAALATTAAVPVWFDWLRVKMRELVNEPNEVWEFSSGHKLELTGESGKSGHIRQAINPPIAGAEDYTFYARKYGSRMIVTEEEVARADAALPGKTISNLVRSMERDLDARLADAFENVQAKERRAPLYVALHTALPVYEKERS